LLTLASVVVLAGVLLWVNELVGASTAATSSSSYSAPDYSAPTSAAPPPSPSPAEAAPSPTAEPAAAQAVYAGRTGGREATVAVAVNGDRAAAYLCDGSSVETWLQGSVTGDQVVLTGRDTAALIGTVSGATLSGTVVTSTGQAWLFSADEARPPAGIYEARTTIDGLATRIGWVVLPDGTQVGIQNVDGDRSPAPALDLEDTTFTLDGAAQEATPVDGSDTVVGQ
jgi:serine/threonine-protein kinase